MNMPLQSDGTVFFNATLFALVRRNLRIKVPEGLFFRSSLSYAPPHCPSPSCVRYFLAWKILQVSRSDLKQLIWGWGGAWNLTLPTALSSVLQKGKIFASILSLFYSNRMHDTYRHTYPKKESARTEGERNAYVSVETTQSPRVANGLLKVDS